MVSYVQKKYFLPPSTMYDDKAVDDNSQRKKTVSSTATEQKDG